MSRFQKTEISPAEFDRVVATENCRAELEADVAVSALHRRFTVEAQAFMRANTFTVYRADPDGRTLVGRVEDRTAQPLSFLALARFPQAPPGMPADADLFRTNRIIVNYCRECDIYVVKDGNHRLLRLAQIERPMDLEVFELSSAHWRGSVLDMRNICPCAREAR